MFSISPELLHSVQCGLWVVCSLCSYQRYIWYEDLGPWYGNGFYMVYICAMKLKGSCWALMKYYAHKLPQYNPNDHQGKFPSLLRLQLSREAIKFILKNYFESYWASRLEIDSFEAKNIIKFHAWLFSRVKPANFETFFKLKLCLWYFPILEIVN